MAKISPILSLLIAGVLSWTSAAPTRATAAEDKIALCHAGLIELPSFAPYDLRLTHGLSDATYRNVTAWACEAEDYPIVYFVGFRVRKIENGTIHVSREKDIVNVISLKALDPELDKHLKVQVYDSDKILCEEVGERCNDDIYHDAHEY